jgi:alpha-glucosidase
LNRQSSPPVLTDPAPSPKSHGVDDAWWRNAVLYQIYARSFQDSDGDGVGDISGITSRLDHLRWLGVDGLWLTPIYPSPMWDAGYDISDHADVDPALGTIAEFDRMIGAAREFRLRVLLDLVPNHTSIEHPWFRDHPDWYTWSKGGPPNNWRAAFGGPAWSRFGDSDRWYLHSFYPEQPDLDWRNRDVAETFCDVVRFWRERGVDGFRVDAVDRLSKDPQLRNDPPATGGYQLPLPADYGSLLHVHSRNAPGIGPMLSALRDAAGDALLLGEVYRPTSELSPYLEHLDLVLCFEFFFSDWNAAQLAGIVDQAASLERVVWVLGNHDFQRLPDRIGEHNLRLAAMLLLTLPGAVLIYQGDEIGMVGGSPARTPFDRAGRDTARHPMQWESDSSGGFTTGHSWLPAVDPKLRNVAQQRGDDASLLYLYRRLIKFRRSLDGPFALLEVDDERLLFRRGRHLVDLNFGPSERPLGAGRPLLSTEPAAEIRSVPPFGGVILEQAVV